MDSDRAKMKLLLLSDTHGQNNILKNLPATDVLIHCGDSTRYGSRDNLREFAEIFGKCPATTKLVIAGNHDRCFQIHPFESRDILLSNGILYLKDEGVEINGIKYWGIPWTPTFLDWYFMANRGEELKKKWDQVPDDVDVLISHGPPYTVLDLLMIDGERIGSVEHHDRVLFIGPTLNVFGHIHEAYGWEQYAGIDFINCSLLNFGYEMVNQPVIYEIKEDDE